MLLRRFPACCLSRCPESINTVNQISLPITIKSALFFPPKRWTNADVRFLLSNDSNVVCQQIPWLHSKCQHDLILSSTHGKESSSLYPRAWKVPHNYSHTAMLINHPNTPTTDVICLHGQTFTGFDLLMCYVAQNEVKLYVNCGF